MRRGRPASAVTPVPSYRVTLSNMDDERLLAAARRAQERLTDAERATEAARAEFHDVVRVLVFRGSQPGDVAASLVSRS